MGTVQDGLYDGGLNCVMTQVREAMTKQELHLDKARIEIGLKFEEVGGGRGRCWKRGFAIENDEKVRVGATSEVKKSFFDVKDEV